ncbi:MAG: TetR/AcrR family transcriptional regulator [Pseudodonghicola sp.]
MFEAVIEVALEKGCAHVTLDAVAREAGISKGGLLYHFKNKAELITAMLSHYDDGWLVDAFEELSISKEPEPIDPLAIAMLVAVAEAPSLLWDNQAKARGRPVERLRPSGAFELLCRRLGMRDPISGP